jgi:hypothetical protein
MGATPLDPAEEPAEFPDEPDSDDEIAIAHGSSESPRLADQQSLATEAARKLGFEFCSAEDDFVLFRIRVEEPGRPPTIRHSGVPLEYLEMLVRELQYEVVRHPNVDGLLIPSLGYSETVLTTGLWGSPYSFDQALTRHATQTTEMQNADDIPNLFPSVGYRSPRQNSDHETINPRVILGDDKSAVRLEISNASPLGMVHFTRFVGSPEPRMRARRLMPTAKLSFGRAMSETEIMAATDEIVRSLVYELDIRNGLVVATRPRRLPRDSRAPGRAREDPSTVRFPRIRLQAEVADLFTFAAQATDNMLLSFLNYYQVLEYFLPAAVKKTALGRIRRELRDPRFDDNSDQSLLAILTEAERSTNISEGTQVRVLVTEYVREDRLTEFFRRDWGNYFSKRGPISGVQAVSPDSPDFVNHVADRIYQIRNRIVHAKDDPKYLASRVLLPLSAEAQALGPDVQLVRLLASEAILASQ